MEICYNVMYYMKKLYIERNKSAISKLLYCEKVLPTHLHTEGPQRHLQLILLAPFRITSY